MAHAEQPIISVKHVSKGFKLPHERFTGLKQAIVSFGLGKKFEVQQVLKDVSLDIQPGEFFGIVGRNGSGKSTLLKLLAQIYVPDKGSVTVNGSLTPFIELGVGFNPQLTGRENVYLNGALLGFDRKQMGTMYDDIVDFAEMSRFMDQKLKNYSSGMQVRLAFSIAIRAKSDILLLDEVLAVGDSAFQKKCYDYFMNLKTEKTTVVLVTHDMNAIRQYCDRAVLVESGQIKAVGKPEEIAQLYQRLFAVSDSSASEEQNNDDRWGNGKVRALRASTKRSASTLSIDITYQVNSQIESLVTGFTVHSSSGQNVFEDNTIKKKLKLGPYSPGTEITHQWKVPNILADGKYTLSVAACDSSGAEYYDWLNKAVTFDIFTGETTAGIVKPASEFKDLTPIKGARHG